MKQRKLYQISILVATAIITVGCSNSPAPAPKIEKEASIQRTPAPVVSGTTLANLKSSGINRVSLKGDANYKQGSSIKFSINTMGKSGYLYIVHLDNKGKAELLYPNKHSPLTELGGEYLFPRDFGNMNISATKDCGGCEQDKTTIYALLSKEPITDIESITKSQLMSFTGIGASQSKGLNMTSSGPRTDNSNLNVGKLEFLVQ